MKYDSLIHLVLHITLNSIFCMSLSECHCSDLVGPCVNNGVKAECSSCQEGWAGSSCDIGELGIPRGGGGGGRSVAM